MRFGASYHLCDGERLTGKTVLTTDFTARKSAVEPCEPEFANG